MIKKTADKTRELFEKAEQPMRAADSESSVNGASRVFSSADEAAAAFTHFRRRLLRVADWNGFSDISSFELFDRNGALQPEKPAAPEDFIKITLPGSGKADWVKIVGLFQSPDETVLTVQPSHAPTGAENENSTSHFFTPDSSNNFCLRRENATINFHVIGLDEKTNTQDTGGVLETVRNFVTANVGSFFGIQTIQWQRFCENFLETGEN